MFGTEKLLPFHTEFPTWNRLSFIFQGHTTKNKEEKKKRKDSQLIQICLAIAGLLRGKTSDIAYQTSYMAYKSHGIYMKFMDKNVVEC